MDMEIRRISRDTYGQNGQNSKIRVCDRWSGKRLPFQHNDCQGGHVRSMERGIRVTRLLVPKRMRNRQKEPRITKICTSIPKYAVIANTRTVVTFIIKMT